MPFLRFLSVLAFALLVSVRPAPAAEDLDVMIGQMILAGFRGYEVKKDSPVMRAIREDHLGGVILFDRDMTRLFNKERNIKSPAQVRRLITSLKKAADIPLLVAVDQEGGRVQRLKEAYGFPETPSAQELGGKGDDEVFAAGLAVGQTLALSGFNLDFAPVADVNVDSESPAIGALGRSFSTDPKRVARCDKLFLDGLTSRGVIGCLKHFPGHGSARGDSHKGVTDVTATWSKKELIPYEMLVQGGEAKVIMTAHIFNSNLDPDYPATLSHKVITGLLREKIGFDGVVITDDMDMGAIAAQYGREESIRLAIEAGADILLFGNNIHFDPLVVRKVHATVRKLVDDGVISRERIQQSYDRIMRLKAKLGGPGDCSLCLDRGVPGAVVAQAR